MMRVTKWGEYGILCSLFLARQAKGSSSVGASEIAASQNIPIQYAQQILQRLRKGGVIKSIRGPKGGYALSRDPINITLKDILYAAEGATFEVICDENPIFGENCATRNCGLRNVWLDLKQAVDELLAQRTLATLLTNEEIKFQFDNGLVPSPTHHDKRLGN